MSATKKVYAPCYGKMIRVKVLDAYEVHGVTLVTVRAVNGRPYVGGDKEAVRTDIAIVEASLLETIIAYDAVPKYIPALEGAQ